MSGGVDNLKTLQCTHSDCWCCVQVEHEERRCGRNECVGSEGSQSVGDGTHGVFTDAVMDVPAAVVADDTTIGL
uniref:Uncharacterized protein n=1 Tax=Tanacetum cinerariifolium TaxID=118510 RepID=A0A699WVT9_TANCI|nr:hypothetical protein [Tanacetum cinerariifolium]